MNNRMLITALAALVSLISAAQLLIAKDQTKPGPRKSPPTLQRQIDELKESQQRVLKQLEEIKTLLQEKSGRPDYAAKPARPEVISLNVHGEPFRGNHLARVAIIEYSDFDCTFCVKYAREIYPHLDEEYIQPGKGKYFFRDLPAPEHPNALGKAHAARCAGEQGKFWEMHDRLFAEQPAPAGQDPMSHAQALGLDAGKFSECLSGDRYAENIRRSTVGAGRMGLNGTPAFLIGTVSEDGDFVRATKVFLGAVSYDSFKAMLDELLASPAKK